MCKTRHWYNLMEQRDKQCYVSDFKLRERLILVKQTTQNNYKRILRCDIYNSLVVTDEILHYHRRHLQLKTYTHSLTHSEVMKTTAGLRPVHWFTCQMTVENHQHFQFEGVNLVLCAAKKKSCENSYPLLCELWPWFVIICSPKHQLIEKHVHFSMNWTFQLRDTCATECTLSVTDTEWQIGGSLSQLLQHVLEGPHVQRMGLHPGQVCTVQLPD